MKKNILFLIFLCIGISSLKGQTPGNSLRFDGTNDYVSATLPSVFTNINNNDFTIETWVKPQGAVFSRVVFAQFDATHFATLSLSATNQIYFYVNNVASIATTATLPTGQWAHIACTWDASALQIQIFVNGVLQAGSGGGTSSTGTNNIMTIGSRTNGAQYVVAELDELRIWDIIRTPCQITSSMNSEFTAAQPNLVAYYNFNQGVAGGTNAGVTALPDFTTNYNGTLLNFALTGTTSNWLSSAAIINQVNVNGAIAGIDTRIACGSYTWINGNTYTSSNTTATHTLAGGASNGCDSIVTLNLTINNPAMGTDVRTACGSYTWIDGNTYTSTNTTATHTLVGGASNGCDSIVTLNLTINNPTTGIDTRITCGSYTWIDGNTYTSNNTTATHTLVGGASSGCDSVVTLNLTINNPTNGTDVRTACGSYTWIDGNTYTSNNTIATHTLVGGASNGCDSVVTLNLTINNPASGTDAQTACDSYTWIDGNTYTASNITATHTLVGGASNGCDSVVILNLIINNSASGTDAQTACDSYTWIDGNTYTASNITATHTLVGGAFNGCDSVVTLNLVINSVDTTVSLAGMTLTATAAGAAYQWVDCNNGNAPIFGETNQSFTPISNGDYAVEITENGCTAMSACFNITGVGIQNLKGISSLNIYPNPTENQINIDFGIEAEGLSLRLFALDGRLLQEYPNINGKKMTLSLANYPAAMYFLEIVNEEGQSTMLKISKL